MKEFSVRSKKEKESDCNMYFECLRRVEASYQHQMKGYDKRGAQQWRDEKGIPDCKVALASESYGHQLSMGRMCKQFETCGDNLLGNTDKCEFDWADESCMGRREGAGFCPPY